ncbi:hypothetical protein MUJ63_10905 [Lachnospiraceae bacterium NSJ-143]|nr:hypothetical protein [Lachnospiraceae bacterium NSJ-143]
MEFKILGIILTSFGAGMLVVTFLPWWGFFAAVTMVAAGIFLIIRKC